MFIPPVKPYFSEDDIVFITEKFREILEGNGFLSQHKYCEQFENEFAKYNNSKYAITTSNGTTSLDLIYRALNLKGTEVIVPSNTMAATIFPLIYNTATPVFADCLDDMTLNPEDVTARITNKTKAVVTVHIGGLVSPATKELQEICESNDLYLIEDAAHAHGSNFNGENAGNFGIAGSFSFFSTKVMTTGEGGMVVTRDETINENIRLIKDQAKVAHKNYHEILGHNFRMTEVQGLMGIRQLSMLDKFIEKRVHLKKIFDEKFQEFDSFEPLEIPNAGRHSLYKYIVIPPKRFDREKHKKVLREKYNAIMGGYVYDVPCHSQPVFKEYSKERLPRTEDLCSRHICPPMYYEMTDEEAEYLIDSIQRCV